MNFVRFLATLATFALGLSLAAAMKGALPKYVWPLGIGGTIAVVIACTDQYGRWKNLVALVVVIGFVLGHLLLL